MNRRAFLSGLIAAPAVIRVAPLMRIVPVPLYGVSPLMSIFDEIAKLERRFMSSTPLPEAAWLAASDAMIFGTGAVEMLEDEIIRPGQFWRQPYIGVPVPTHLQTELPSPLS